MAGLRCCWKSLANGGIGIVLAAATSVGAQDSGTRGVTPEEFIKARPAKAGASAYKSAHSSYKRVGPALQSTRGDAQQMGITIWRLRPSLSRDGGPRILVQEGAASVSWTPERVAAGTPLRMGDRVRLSIESPHTGYLYVIDREQYASGDMGDPYLIFPSTRINNGDNKVTAGKIVEVPAQDDRPNYFTLRQSRGDQSGELLTVLITDKPLSDIQPGAKALALSKAQVEDWEKQWGRQSERFDLSGGAGRTWTKAEQQAGLDGTRRLTQDDPGPQTIYRIAGGAGPVLARVELKYRTAGTQKAATAKKPTSP
jgi:Domain of unknown function (DUF4384)